MTTTNEQRMGPPDPDWPNDEDLGLCDQNMQDWEDAIGGILEPLPKLGTAWCAPGEGATVAAVFYSVHYDVALRVSCKAHKKLSTFFAQNRGAGQQKTNLTFTGHSFTPEDCERILSERFQVGA